MTDDFDGLPGVDDASAMPGVKPIDIAALRRDFDRLALLDPLEFELVQKHEAKLLGVSLTTLKREVAARRPRIEAPDGGASIVEALEPWPHDVSGIELAETIRRHLRAHVVFEQAGDADAVTLWTLAGYAMDAWAFFPKLLVTSPAMRSGKSTLLRLVEAFALRSFMTSNLTGPNLFRLIDQHQPCLLIDEADQFLANTPELVGIINASHLRRTARTIRCVEVAGEQTLRAFSTWTPMVIAGIGRRADTIEDRGVSVSLMRRRADQPVERLPVDFFERMTETRRKLITWSKDVDDALAVSTSEPPDAGNDRRRDNWTPLWRVAEALGGDWPARAEAAYLAAAAAELDEEADDDAAMLLHDLREIFEARPHTTHLPTDQLLEALIALGRDHPWYDWQEKGRPISGSTLGKLARRYGIGPIQVKKDGRNQRLWCRERVEKAWRAYAPAKGETTRYPVTAVISNDNPPHPLDEDNLLISIDKKKEEGEEKNDETVRNQRGSGVSTGLPPETRYSGTREPGTGDDPPPDDWSVW